MNLYKRVLCLLTIAGSFFLSSSTMAEAQTAGANSALPHLEKRGKAEQFIVDGKPFLMLGGELHNSSSSSVAYMKPIWPRLAAMHLNTVLAPVAWETIEPQEGHFDFTVVDGLIEDARRSNLKIVVLWFGSWKNTYSSYVPSWVKDHPEKFPRVQTSDGRGTERLSTFGASSLEADARAFASLMRHLKTVDGSQHTVVLIQVENEVGVIPEARDRSAAADTAFNAAVPTALTTYMQSHRESLVPEFRAIWESHGAKTSGSWQEVFGKSSTVDDFFMAWQFATYINKVAAAGKAEYPLPMYTNAALVRPNYQPGQYNSGGPLPHSLDIWHAAGTALDFLSPDIYFNEFVDWAQSYTHPNNPLFIPETQSGAAGAANSLYAFGQLAALGFSPFGIDDEKQTPIDLAGISGERDRLDGTALSGAYAVLSKLSPLIAAKQSTGEIAAVVMEGEAQRAAKVSLGDYTMTITRGATGAPGSAPRVAALFIQTGPNKYDVIGVGSAQVTFAPSTPGPPIASISSIDEDVLTAGEFVRGRRLNGDENSQASRCD